MRVATGNADQSQYRIAVLAEPAEPLNRWPGLRAWNGKVYVPHGSGCGMGHSEGAAPNVLLDLGLSRGHAVMSTALEHNTENCNVVVQAESVMIAKERLIEPAFVMMTSGCRRSPLTRAAGPSSRRSSPTSRTVPLTGATYRTGRRVTWPSARPATSGSRPVAPSPTTS